MCPKKITVDGIDYYARQEGKRHVVVVDRGWIFAGDLTENEGRIRLTNALWVFRWESIGFNGVIENPESSKCTIKKVEFDIDIPSDAELFRIPVCDDWGL